MCGLAGSRPDVADDCCSQDLRSCTVCNRRVSDAFNSEDGLGLPYSKTENTPFGEGTIPPLSCSKLTP